MMPDKPEPAPADLARRVARLVRHDVGDFLQGVYTTLAVLQSRLEAGRVLEHRLTSDLMRRAELVRAELDAVVALLAEDQPGPGEADLAALARGVVAGLRRSHPDAAVSLDAAGEVPVTCDGAALADAAGLLLAALVPGSKGLSVRIETAGGPVCILERQGVPPSPSLLAWLDTPFATTQQGLLGLALALCVRVVARAGGQVAADVRESSVAIRISLPAATGP